MEIIKEKNGKNVNLKITGSINSDNYHDFEKEVMDLNFDGLVLTIDFENVPYITSVVFRVLLMIRKQVNKENLIIRNTNSDIKNIFYDSGFDEMVTFDEEERIKDDDFLHMSYKELLARKVKNLPDKKVYFIGDKSYSWKEIDEMSQIIASDLKKIGIEKGTHVGLMSTNSINWICCFFALSKIGAIIALLNFNSKEDEVEMLIDIGDIEYICYGYCTGITNYDEFFNKGIKNKKFVKAYNISSSINYQDRLMEYDNIKNDYKEKVNADDPSMIIFTSGSTSKPKAVLVSAYNRINSCFPGDEFYLHDVNDRMCMYLPMYHVFSFLEVVPRMLIYDFLCFISLNSKVETVLDTIQKNKCTFFPTVPTMLINIIENKDFDCEMVDSVTRIVIGGEAMTENHILKVKDTFKNAEIEIGYGSSEVVPITKTKKIDTIEHITKTVGFPVNGIKIKIKDPITEEDVEDGKEGEICVYSEASMIGYYKLPIENQAINKEGYIKTGDLGIIEKDGYIRLTGRCKELIIRAGENISPNEIASVISNYEDIANVKVIGVPDDKLGESVCACLVLKKEKKFDEEKIRQYLKDKLSKYKIPKDFVIFDKFPLLSNNKLDVLSIKKLVKEKLFHKM